MATKNINIRVDEQLKEQAEYVFDELGVSMSSAFIMFLKSVVRCGGFPMELKISSPNPETLAAMEDVEKKRNLSRTFPSVHDLMEDLNA